MTRVASDRWPHLKNRSVASSAYARGAWQVADAPLEKHRRQRTAELRRAVAQPAPRAASYRGADIIETETEAPSSLLLSLPQPARVVPHGGSRACQGA